MPIEQGQVFPVAHTQPQTAVPRVRFVRATGEHRPPRRGEWYISGAVVEGYQAPGNYADYLPFHIAEPVGLVKCPHCGGHGWVTEEGNQ
jgi:hypothetical protein